MKERTPNNLTVLMLSPEYPPDYASDVSRHVYYLSTTLAKQKVKVYVIALSSEGCMEEDTIKGVKVYRLKRTDFALQETTMAAQMKQFLPRFIKRFLPSIEEIDVVHAHDWKMALASRELCELKNIPLVVSFHNLESGFFPPATQAIPRSFTIAENFMKKRICFVERLIAQSATHLILKSQFTCRLITELFSINNGCVDIIPYGIPEDTMSSIDIDLRTFRSIFATPSQAVVSFVGNKEDSSAISYLRALPRVISEYPEVRFIIAISDAFFRHVWEEIANLNLNRVVFPLNNVAGAALSAILRCTDVLVIPSSYEASCGLIALECMAYGLPVVAYEESVFSELIQHGVNGIKVPKGEPDSLAKAIIHLLFHPDEREKLKETARKHIKENYSSVKEAQSTLLVYESLTKGKEVQKNFES